MSAPACDRPKTGKTWAETKLGAPHPYAASVHIRRSGARSLTTVLPVEMTLGTFNLNNLFSRFNFRAEIPDTGVGPGVEIRTSFRFDDPTAFKLRTYRGRLVRRKNPADQRRIVERILAMDLDVLAVQEVEDVDTLKVFAAGDLAGRYPNVVLVEGNDPRLIDVGLLTRDSFPIGAVTSWRHIPDPSDPSRPVFSRDLLQVDVWNRRRTRKLVTVFNTHLKSHFVPFDVPDPDAERQRANELRGRQADAIKRIVRETVADSAFVVVGDMNDPPDSAALRPLTRARSLRLADGLAAPTETRPAPPDVGDPPPTSPAWTHRFKDSGKPAEYRLFDHIWLSPVLAERQTGAFIDRRTRLSGDGSDHDPAWVSLAL